MKMDMKEMMTLIEKFLKSGRFSLSLLDWDKRNKAVTNELIVKYDEAQAKPMLYIKNPNGKIVPIITESDKDIKNFLENFLEVSVNRTKNYEPSMWFMLREDGNHNTNINESTVDQFHKYIEANYNQLKPYALQIFRNNQRELLIPYIDTKFVFYDLGKLMAGESTENFDEVVHILYTLITEIRDNLTTIMSTVEDKFNSMNDKLLLENERQNAEIDSLNKQIDQTNKRIEDLIGTMTGVSGQVDRRLTPKTISVGGDANKIYPVRIKYNNTGKYPVDGGYEKFMAMMFLTMENTYRNIVVQIGHNHMTTSNAYFVGDADSYFCYTHKIKDGSVSKHYIYDVKQVGSGDYVLLLRGAQSYTLWSKYPDDITVTNTLGNIDTGSSGTYSPIVDTDKSKNPNLTDDKILGMDACRTFTNSVHVVNSIIIGNNTRMRIGG